MRKALLSVLLLSVSFCTFAQLRVLVIDQSQTLVESMRLLAVVRALKPYGIAFEAVTYFPTTPWTSEPVVFVVYIPAQGPYIWFCPPGLESSLPQPLQEMAQKLHVAFAQAFLGVREVRGPSQDLYPLLLALHFARLGVFGRP